MSPLRTWRGERSLEEVAALLEITPATLSRIERGETWVGREIARRLRELTGLSLDDLLIDPTKDNNAA
jgi:transcriptional regulator with XRE-family HTH domain